MNKLMKNKKKKGFTLVELIAVIAIIGILAAIIVPMIGKYTERAKVSKAQEEMRQYVMAVETASADTGVKIDSTILGYTHEELATAGDADTVKLYDAANEIVNLADLTKIKGVTLSDAKIGAADASRVTVTSEGVATVS